MSLRRILAVLAVVAVVAVGGAAAFIAGVGPLGDIGGGASDTVTETPESTGTVYGDAGGSSGDSGGATNTASGGSSDANSLPPYTFAVTSIEECGQTCRDVTVRLDNNRNETATGVTMYTRIFAGNSTDSSDKVWEGKRDVGTLEAGESITATSRVQLSYSEGYQVKQADGWVTILTTVESDDVTITFKQRRDVL
ncbi:hypothetical protein [Halobaculum gomorrense]|uniref:Uncharacterized protein n=1 Tax=Halobaculum gomorrense TaxID=43928 RepID=A0A1M5KHH4_9EURY|nr:hypothetical protein [Halobaculum gomorrense]SHG52211.1 hypothetical protein SAMN05443636_0513 [Halobaculum gomorrense]